MTDLSVEIAGLRFANPIIVGACSLTSTLEGVEALVDAGAGGIITKAISPDPLPGAGPTPHLVASDGGMAVLADARLSLGRGCELISQARERTTVPIIANVIGRSDDGEVWADACRELEAAGAQMVELDLNCHPEGETHLKVSAEVGFYDAFSIGQDAAASARVVRAVKRSVTIPVISKMTLRAPDLLAVAIACEDAGTDVLSGVNAAVGIAGTDTENFGKPLMPGLQTQSLAPICGSPLNAAGRKWTGLLSARTSLPYISGSGVMTVHDVVERIMLGAHAIAIVTAIYLNGLRVIRKLVNGLARSIEVYGSVNPAQVRGWALERLVPRGQASAHPVVAQVQNWDAWERIRDDLYDGIGFACPCLRRGLNGTVELVPDQCTGCGLPALQAPQAVGMVAV